MKDLDFDELDRAVNSLMTNVPKSEPQTDGTPEKTLDIPSTSGGEASLSFDKMTEAAKKVTEAPEPKADEKPIGAPVAASAPRASAAAQHASRSMQAASAPTPRRAGRFMDVVHPSADMKKPDAPKPVSRQGVSLEPLSSPSQKIADVVPQKKDAKEAAPKPAVSPAEDKSDEKPAAAPIVPETPAPPAPEEEPSTDKSMSDWPDPLDMMSSAEPEKKEEAPEEPKNDEIQPEVEPETAPAPLASPFLPDAKVEKRPLGGIAPEEDAPIEDDMISRAPMADDTKKSVDDPNNQLPANPTEVEQALPEELSGDLMAVEADTTHAELKRTHDESQAAAPQEKPAAPEKPEQTEPEPVVDIENKPVSAGPTSIPQQYKEEPSTGDQDNGSIYDTDTYHQPLAHPAKKKSDWMWVLWIVLILVLGAGGGALLFILKLV